MPIEVLDPTWGEQAHAFTQAEPLESLSGATVGIVSNGKQGTRAFFAALADELLTTHGAAEVITVVKSNYSAPAEASIMDGASRWSALISGIGD